MAEQSGEEFGPYLLEEVIGRGGMGVVYRAYDTRRDRTVALKRLPRELAEDEHFQARFRRESRLAARLNEPHIIPIHDFGEHDGQLFLDMRLVEGTDLSTLISDEGGRLGIELAVDIIVQVSAALSAAHNAGLMHRDIKPSNVLISGMTAEDRTSPFAYLVDFGIARAIGNEGTALTSTTDWFGTVAYMAPERISGSSGDARSDIYSLACLFYQCLTGQAPYTGEALQVLFAHVNNAPPSASEKAPAVTPGLDAAIRRGMAKKPEDRFQTVAQFAAAVKSAARAGSTLTGIPTTPQQARGPFGPLPPSGGRAGGPSFPPRSGPPTSSPPVPPPHQSVPPGPAPHHSPPHHSVPPHAGPATSQPPHAGPATSQPPYAGPRTSQPPSQPPYSGPRTSQPPQSGPRASVRPHAGPHTSQPPQSGPRAAQPPYAGPHNSQPPRSGPPHSIPPRPAPPVNNKPLLIMIAVAVVVVLAAIMAVVVATSGDGDPNASGTGQVARSQSLDPSATTSGSLVGSQTSPTSGPAWSEPYRQFGKLIGTTQNSPSTAYRGAHCTLTGPDAGIDGMLDQASCKDLDNDSKVVFYVGRFSGKAAVDSYLVGLVKQKYSERDWTIDQINRGRLLTSPSAVGYADVTSSICAQPQFLVQFYAAEGSGVTVSALQADYWKQSVFPDTTPAACSS